VTSLVATGILSVNRQQLHKFENAKQRKSQLGLICLVHAGKIVDNNAKDAAPVVAHNLHDLSTN
jgi:hypothetical protein